MSLISYLCGGEAYSGPVLDEATGGGGEKSLPSQQIGSRCLVYLPQTNIDQIRGRIGPVIFVFLIRRISLAVLISGEIQRSLYNPRIHRPAHLNV